MLSHHIHLALQHQSTLRFDKGISNYDALHMVMKANRSTLVQCLRRRYAEPCNDKPVYRHTEDKLVSVTNLMHDFIIL